jgi:hypothetical protein
MLKQIGDIRLEAYEVTQHFHKTKNCIEFYKIEALTNIHIYHFHIIRETIEAVKIAHNLNCEDGYK